MGIGRREFLKTVSLALVGISIDPTQAVSTDEHHTYINKKIGVIFKKPNNWDFLSIKDYGKILSEDLDSNEWQDFKTNYLNDNLDKEIMCILSKNTGMFTSFIFLSVTPRIDYRIFERLGISVEPIGEVSPDLEQCLNFETIRIYEPEFISNCEMKQSDSRYSRIINNKVFNFEMRNLTFEFHEYYLNFQCHKNIELTEDVFTEFEKMKSSIVLR